MQLLDCGVNRKQGTLKNIYKFLLDRKDGKRLFVAILTPLEMY